MNLNESGYLILDYPFANDLKSFVIDEDFLNLDKFLLEETKNTGRLFNFLSQFQTFKYLEHIIAIREVPDDDGIWHDDGSRLIGFSLSLNLDPNKISGGNLNIRKKNSPENIVSIPPQPFGKIIIFQTGQFDIEHKVDMVTKGKRIIIAGWGSDILFNY